MNFPRMTTAQKVLLADVYSTGDRGYWPLNRELQSLKALVRKGYVTRYHDVYKATAQTRAWFETDEPAEEPRESGGA